MNILRWILVLPAAFAGWLLGIEVGFLIDGLSNITCSKHYQVSETCAAPWAPLVAEFAITTGAAVAAVAIVGFTALMAPQWRARVAWLAYGMGALFAVYAAVEIKAWVPSLAAVIAGAIAARLLTRRFSQSQREHPRHSGQAQREPE
jgi:hypothetical protein